MRTITVKGTGQVSAKPDYVILSMKIATTNQDYNEAMYKAAERIEKIQDAIASIGYSKEDLKTTRFCTDTFYNNLKDKDGNYQKVFLGYTCTYNVKLSFDFDNEKLARTIAAIANSGAKPEINIAFTVKDPTAVSKKVLINATENAREKAEILCKAAGSELGELISINYNWGEINIISNTRYDMPDIRLCKSEKACIASKIEPDDINVHDTATFVWEIK